MSDLINPGTPASTNSDELTELKNTCAALQAQTHTLRLVLLLVVVSLCLFFLREASFNSNLVAQMQPQITQISQLTAQLEKQGSSLTQQMQVLQGAAMRLAEYGKTHPDYAQILAKYGIGVTPAAPAAKPATPTAAPAKK